MSQTMQVKSSKKDNSVRVKVGRGRVPGRLIVEVIHRDSGSFVADKCWVPHKDEKAILDITSFKL